MLSHEELGADSKGKEVGRLTARRIMRTRRMRTVGLFMLVSLGGITTAAPAARAQPQEHFFYHVECDPPIGLGEPYTHDDTNDPEITFAGAWKPERPGRGLYKGTQHITNSGGSTASFVLSSPPYAFAFGFTKMRNAGKAAVYFNDRFITTLDMYAPVTDYNCTLTLYGGVPHGTFLIKALNQKNPASSGTYINIDYVHFEP